MAVQGKQCHRCGGAVSASPSECPFCSAHGVPLGMVTFHEAIEQNRRASYLLTAALVVTAVLVGYVTGKAQGHTIAGVMLALSILAVLAIVTLTSGKEIPLLVNSATKADAETELLLTNIIEELKIASGLRSTPEVYVIEDGTINAFASALSDEAAAIAVTRGAIGNLTREELQGVLAHEVSHILGRDTRYFLFLSVFVGSVVMISDLFLKIGLFSRRARLSIGLVVPALFLALFSPLIVTILRFAISRKREFLADARAVQMTRNPAALASALRKTTRFGSRIEGVNRATRHMFILNPSPANGFGDRFLFSTHPPVEERIKRLQMMGARFFQK